MKLLKDYSNIQQKIFDYFGYKEDWVCIPLSDETDKHWFLDGDGYGNKVFYHEKFTMDDATGGQFYSGSIYTQRFLPKWVYRGEDYTMVSVDTHTDGNKFLMIFDNSKEIKDKKVREAALEF